LTADDVIATYNYHRGEDSKSAAKGLLSAVKDIRKDGDNMVIFELEAANADFPYIVSDYHLFDRFPSETPTTSNLTAHISTRLNCCQSLM